MVILKFRSFSNAVLVSVFFAHHFVASYMLGNNPYRRRETLDDKNKYQLEWLVDWSTKSITFNVTVETLGYVGFGLSDSGKMSGADLVIGGVTPSGKTYFSDYHAVGSQVPELDPSQDWKLHRAQENGTHTLLSFSRSFNTHDKQDYPITEDKMSIIWSYGERDNPTDYHHANRGSYDVYLIYPDYTPYIERDPATGDPLKIGDHSQPGVLAESIQVWTIPQVFRVPSNTHTTYWCTMKRAPRLSQKHHFVGFELRYNSEESRRAIHHVQLTRCYAPKNLNAESLFFPFLDYEGQLCYQLTRPTGLIPTDYCTYTVFGFALGFKGLFTPSHIGHPFGFAPDEYYVMQVHYDNPQQRSDLTVDLKLDLYYTSQLRQNEGGILGVGQIFPGTPPSIMVPPSSLNHVIYAHCAPSCTSEMLPAEGIKIYAFHSHAHNSGRRMKMEHFRNGQELELVQKDDNFSPSFQYFHMLNKEFHVLPGDHLIMNCGYDNTWTNETVVGGFSPVNEMCVGFVLYYNKINYSTCVSDIVSEQARRQFLAGVSNITWSESRLEYMVTSPRSLTGQSVREVSNNLVVWNIEKREKLQRFHKSHPYINFCTQDENC